MKASDVAKMQATLLCAETWPLFKILRLTQNMRLQRAISNADTTEERKKIIDFDAYTKTYVGEGKGNLSDTECIRDPKKRRDS